MQGIGNVLKGRNNGAAILRRGLDQRLVSGAFLVQQRAAVSCRDRLCAAGARLSTAPWRRMLGVFDPAT
jgi:hypothetical protein